MQHLFLLIRCAARPAAAAIAFAVALGCGRSDAGDIRTALDSTRAAAGVEVTKLPAAQAALSHLRARGEAAADSGRRYYAIADSVARLESRFHAEREAINSEVRKMRERDRTTSGYADSHRALVRRTASAEAIRDTLSALRGRQRALGESLGIDGVAREATRR